MTELISSQNVTITIPDRATDGSSTKDPHKYENAVAKRINKIWWGCAIAAATTLAAAITASFFLSGPLLATAITVSSVVLGVLLVGKLVHKLEPHLPHKLQRVVNVITALTAEFALLPLAAYLFLFKRTASREDKQLDKALAAQRAAIANGDPRPAPSAKRPILLIHGYLHNSSAWWMHKKILEKEGYGPIYTIDLGSPLKSIEQYSELVQRKLDKIAELHGRKDVTLIAHSMGGVVSSDFATRLTEDGRVKDIITLGTPAQGTYAARVGVVGSFGCSKAAKDMLPNSKFMKRVTPLVENLVKTQIYNMTSGADEIILPNRFAAFKSQPQEKRKHFKDMGHVQYLFSGRVADALLSRLATAHANEATDMIPYAAAVA